MRKRLNHVKEPTIEERDSDVLVTIRHEPLASSEQTILKYLDKNESIRNKKAREITYIRDADQMKRLLIKMTESGEIEASPALNLAVKLTAGNRGNKKILATQGEERENALDGYDRKLW